MQDNDGNTALHLAALYDRQECVQLLLKQYNFAVDITNNEGVMAKNSGQCYPKMREIF